MKFSDIVNGTGPRIILLSKEEGEYHEMASGDTVLEVLRKIIPLYKKAAEDNGTTLEKLLKLEE